MLQRISTILGWLRSLLASRSDLLIENLALIGALLMIAGYPRPVIADTNYTGAAENKF